MACRTCSFWETQPHGEDGWCKAAEKSVAPRDRCEDYAYCLPVFEVPCPNCGQPFLQITREYDPDRMANGRMFELTEQYGPSGYNWSVFPHDEYVCADALECPGCGSPIVGFNGRIAGYESHVPVLIPKEDTSDGKEEEGQQEGSPGTEEGRQEEVAKAPDVWVCEECGKTFNKRAQYQGHMGSHKRWKDKG